MGDQIQKVNKVNWMAAWNDASSNFIEVEDTYSLNAANTLDEVVKNIVKILGLQPAERSDKVPEGKTTHTLLLAGNYMIFFYTLPNNKQHMFTGIFRGGYDVLVRAKLALSDGLTMQLTVKTTNSEVAELITSYIA